ncbi:MAG: hypothetical protein J5757_05515 [Lachnospiraceae bacterium]|nr:hypothetical protein [Lachnospiraceae bacterium]
MVKNYNCPRCGSTARYNLRDGKLHCPSCIAIYESEEFNVWKAKEQEPEIPREEVEEERRFPMIRMQIAVCNSCGAELAVNDVEASSFCPYCGNASIVMDRVEERLAPDYIIPFKITQEEAEQKIREHMESGQYVPEEIKNFEIEKIRGIYIPFWLYDVYYGAEESLHYTDSSQNFSTRRHDHKISDCIFHRLTVDASRMFDDVSSQRLEPYDMHGLKKFDPVYLSGFYSDRFDVGQEEADEIALERARVLFYGLDVHHLYTSNKPPKADLERKEVLNRAYAFLPVWFLTFRHNDQPYTILVNGQTGKLVSAVVTDHKKAVKSFVKLAPVCMLLFGIISCLLMEGAWTLGTYLYDGKPVGNNSNVGSGHAFCMYLIIFEVIAMLFILIKAVYRFRCLRKSVKISRSRSNHRLANERQDRT